MQYVRAALRYLTPMRLLVAAVLAATIVGTAWVWGDSATAARQSCGHEKPRWADQAGFDRDACTPL